MKDIHTESYENLGKNMTEEDLKSVLSMVDHKMLLEELGRRLDRSVALDTELNNLVSKYER